MGKVDQVRSQQHIVFIVLLLHILFCNVIFKVRLPYLSVYYCFSKKGNVEQHFLTVNKNYNSDFPFEKQAEKGKGEETKIPLFQTAVTFSWQVIRVR